MIKTRFGDRIDDWIHTAFPFLFKRSIDPNLLTVIGCAVSCSAGVAFGFGWLPLGGVLLLAGGFFDLVDGVVARHYGTSTPFGAFLDSTLDRLVDMAVLFGLVMHYAAIQEPVLLFLTGVVWVMSVMTSYAKARADQVVGNLKGGWLERGERVGLLAAGSILGIMQPILWVLAAGTTWTVVQRFSAAHRALSEPKVLERAAANKIEELEGEQR